MITDPTVATSLIAVTQRLFTVIMLIARPAVVWRPDRPFSSRLLRFAPAVLGISALFPLFDGDEREEW